ncbi:DNA replication and repair protein RecF [Anaeromyxobacter diazotrophicus]|uniref:DNA replication and repair protein RecF n=1 Tax=Anaeromyxobacter diazotrophicus TaxID=2590199 RepID=A0A7I9VMQ9_9BACT|nr:DNA replication and repair protein RecF [Anaeromyxobacter diazotrophicus]
MLLGENGQGKTNLLEAVYFACTLKPLRAARLAELVRFGAERALVAADVEGPGGARRVAVEVAAGVRTASLDGKPQERLDAYFEGLAAVCFAPDDLLLVKGGPDARRRFLDRAAFNRWPAVLAEARDYVRALRARNAALRASAPEVEVSFRGPLVRTGARLLRRRLELLGELAPRVAGAYAEISGPGAPSAHLGYRAAAGVDAQGDEAALAEQLAAALEARAGRDRERGYTSAGPHMDDLTLALDARGARAFASQGQQRALVLALKVAEIENLRAVLGRPPLLLLDDVSSELDPQKNRFLLDYLGRLPGQAFLTTTDRRLLEPAAGPDTAFYRVVAGAFTRED